MPFPSPSPSRILLFLLPLGLALSGCDGLFTGPDREPRDPPLTELPRSLTHSESRVIGAGNGFGLQLLRELSMEDPSSTIFISPFSASMALAMALNGAQGETAAGMRTALHLGDLPEEEMNRSYHDLLALLAGLDRQVEMTVANAVWFQEDLTLHEEFRGRVSESFGAVVRGLDFTSPSAPVAINDWVRGATGGRIQRMVPDAIPGNVVAYLMNAVHFKGAWTVPFDPRRTASAPFHLPDGSTAPVLLMHRDDTVSYHVTSRYAAVELPYSRGAYAMTVVVPQGEETVQDLLAGLGPEEWDALTRSLEAGRALVALPRFQVEWDGVLNDVLSSMGMERAFHPGADFMRMFRDGSPWISEVQQKTFLRVDEVGTEAAAVTSVAMVQSAPPSIRADRPFLLVIRERFSGTILFLGVVVEAPTGG